MSWRKYFYIKSRSHAFSWLCPFLVMLGWKEQPCWHYEKSLKNCWKCEEFSKLLMFSKSSKIHTKCLNKHFDYLTQIPPDSYNFRKPSLNCICYIEVRLYQQYLIGFVWCSVFSEIRQWSSQVIRQPPQQRALLT